MMGRLDKAAERINKARALAEDDSELKTLARSVWLAQKIERISDFLSRFAPPIFP